MENSYEYFFLDFNIEVLTHLEGPTVTLLSKAGKEIRRKISASNENRTHPITSLCSPCAQSS